MHCSSKSGDDSIRRDAKVAKSMAYIDLEIQHRAGGFNPRFIRRCWNLVAHPSGGPAAIVRLCKACGRRIPSEILPRNGLISPSWVETLRGPPENKSRMKKSMLCKSAKIIRIYRMGCRGLSAMPLHFFEPSGPRNHNFASSPNLVIATTGWPVASVLVDDLRFDLTAKIMSK